MPTLIPWTNVEIGDLDVFTPFLPSLIVYTWYVDDEPESTITYVWRDENTGMVHHETVLVAPLSFDEAVTRAKEEAPKRSVERIHVKHARSNKPKAKRAAKVSATPTKKRASAKRTPAKPAAARRS